jgi:methanogenic corrinoid protein MtbC1
VEANLEKKGTVMLGTVKGDMHDIGKNLVRMMLEGKGLSVVDLGVNVPAETFVAEAARANASVICCSALLTTTMSEMKSVIEELERQGIRNRFKVMVGGAPVTQHFCDSIGADGYSPDAASAADLALSFCI